MEIRAHELMFHGTELWSLRLLSHGRFLSVVPARSVAESIIASRLLSATRKKHYDIDGAAEAVWRHVHPDKEPPSKTSDSTQLFQPMIDMMLLYSVDSEKPSSAAASAAKTSGQNPGPLPLPIAGQEVEHNDTQLTKLDSIPEGALKSHVKKLQGQSIPAVQSWCKTFKKTVSADKFAEFEELAEEITSQIEDANNKLTKDKSRELAIKFGLPMSVVNKMGVKSLGSVVALATVLAA
eukprot:s3203_g4.t1